MRRQLECVLRFDGVAVGRGFGFVVMGNPLAASGGT